MIPRVALVTHDFNASGGVASMTRFLYRALNESGRFKPEIISLAQSASDAASVRARTPATWPNGIHSISSSRDGVPFVHIGAFFSEFEYQRYRPRALLTEMLNAYDLVQVVAGTPPWMFAATNVTKPKFLWTATMVRPDRLSRLHHARGFRRWWLTAMTRAAEWYERRGLRVASGVFALSDYTLASVRRVLGPKAGVVAPCGVDTDAFQAAPANRNGCILCVGRLDDPRKNTALLVEAYARLRRQFPNAPELWLVGPSPPREALQLISQNGLADHVRLLGPKKPAELQNLYRAASFFALSSDEEGLGIVLLEAMASGLPVVSTACGGPESIVEHDRTGLLVPLSDAHALAAAMGRLVASPALCIQMGEEARRVAVERFSISATSRIFLNKYEETLSGADLHLE